ncbi:hypothetical protein [Actinotalea sp. K2]|uniref:hypothetical protein n=1 Tax=Actinotalea sp. K2 TaxID=2939438 RepID=UPI0020170884|nr:hypothetical protein [Actinotalea sp. K2]MCL3861189.1 hypothetical protein [Actinotalea sp. K2]
MTDTAPLDVTETLALAGTALGASLSGAVILGGAQRSLVLRCTAPDGATLVVKRFEADADGRERFAREHVGLTTLTRTPDLLGVDATHEVLVMSDLGPGPTLADLLLGSDREAAWAGALDWAEALGTLLAGARDRVPEVESRLAAAGIEVWDAEQVVRDGLARLGALVPGIDERSLVEDLVPLSEVLAVRGSDSARRALAVSPGDTCPDNAVRTSEGWRFLDLEGTSTHHPALDAAYLALPFATCWCVFDPPAGLTDAMLARFTAALAPAYPDVVAEPGWSRAVDLACAGWILAATTWLAPGALADRQSTGPSDRPSPTFRQLLTSRWRWGAAHLAGTTPSLAAAFARAAGWAEDEWGTPATTPAPYAAFTGP